MRWLKSLAALPVASGEGGIEITVGELQRDVLLENDSEFCEISDFCVASKLGLAAVTSKDNFDSNCCWLLKYFSKFNSSEITPSIEVFRILSTRGEIMLGLARGLLGLALGLMLKGDLAGGFLASFLEEFGSIFVYFLILRKNLRKLFR